MRFWPNPLTFLIAVIVIGSRQLGLAILMHDAAHGVLDAHALAERMGRASGSAPIPSVRDTISYRHYHLKHHRSTQQPDDPDLGLSAPFPITRASYRRKFIRDITGQTGFKQRKFQFQRAWGEKGLSLRAACLELLEQARRRADDEPHPAGDPHRARQAALLPDVLAPAEHDLADGHHPHPQHRRARRGARQQRRVPQRAHDLCLMVGARAGRALLGQLSRRPSPAVLRALLQPAEAARACCSPRASAERMEIRANYRDVLTQAMSKPEPQPA